MFDFEKLSVFEKIRFINKEIFTKILSNKSIDLEIRDQIKRASLSSLLNLAEGSGRESKADKKHFYVMSKTSLLEVSALLIVIEDVYFNDFNYLKDLTLECIKMMSGLIKSVN
ncbi:MAG: four helix bundle protein [Cytophagaceae bacterium]|nr:four helix bundle protein [Cytophagaceae bacterium]MBK9508065.1 four helix bundle protein [Cytophagaceae bacterium]MBK9936471.1 four helix bundle protein [Cytophagaceae bacterium]MBL0300220.1 four helix bundle protein [Cytophagaceae bacterium]MBL0327157.1 four helix bundle protein [Cytophagaceae bacterium]